MSPAPFEFTRDHAEARPRTRILHVWGWEIPVYLFLGGFTAGIMVLSGWSLWRGRRNPRSHPTFSLASSGLFMLGLGTISLGMLRPLPRPRATSRTSGGCTRRSSPRRRCPGAPGSCCSSTRRSRGAAAGAAGAAASGCFPALGRPVATDWPTARGARIAPSASSRSDGHRLGIYTGVLLRPSARGRSGTAPSSARSSWPRGSRAPPPSSTGPRPSRRSGAAGAGRQPLPHGRARPLGAAPDRPAHVDARPTPRPRACCSAGRSPPSSGSASWGSASSCRSCIQSLAVTHRISPHARRADARLARRSRAALRHRLRRPVSHWPRLVLTEERHELPSPTTSSTRPRPRAARVAQPYMNPYLAGIGLGLVLLAAFVLDGPRARRLRAPSTRTSPGSSRSSRPAREVNEFLAEYLEDGHATRSRPGSSSRSLGVFVGGFLSGLLAGRRREARSRRARASRSATRLAFAFVGGALMGIGAKLRPRLHERPGAHRRRAAERSGAGPS